MWAVIVAVIAGLIFLAVLIFSIPFDLAWQIEVYGKPKYKLRWAWLFGLVSREIKPSRRAPKKPKPKRKPKKGKSRFGIRTVLEFLRIKGLVSQLIRLVRQILHCFHIRRLEAEFVVGLDDPADTFWLFAVTEPVNRLLDYFQPFPVSIRPSFTEAALEGYTRGMLRIYPIQFTLPVIRFIFSLPVFRLIRKVIAVRWRNGK